MLRLPLTFFVMVGILLTQVAWTPPPPSLPDQQPVAPRRATNTEKSPTCSLTGLFRVNGNDISLEIACVKVFSGTSKDVRVSSVSYGKPLVLNGPFGHYKLPFQDTWLLRRGGTFILIARINDVRSVIELEPAVRGVYSFELYVDQLDEKVK